MLPRALLAQRGQGHAKHTTLRAQSQLASGVCVLAGIPRPRIPRARHEFDEYGAETANPAQSSSSWPNMAQGGAGSSRTTITTGWALALTVPSSTRSLTIRST
jgi:hypothetical protein